MKRPVVSNRWVSTLWSKIKSSGFSVVQQNIVSQEIHHLHQEQISNCKSMQLYHLNFQNKRNSLPVFCCLFVFFSYSYHAEETVSMELLAELVQWPLMCLSAPEGAHRKVQNEFGSMNLRECSKSCCCHTVYLPFSPRISLKYDDIAFFRAAAFYTSCCQRFVCFPFTLVTLAQLSATL